MCCFLILFQIHIKDNYVVERALCTCPRGAYQCHHMAALLIFANRNISKTDERCSWKGPTKDCYNMSSTVNEIWPPAKKFKATFRPVNESDSLFFGEGVKELDRYSTVWPTGVLSFFFLDMF